jgi:hypothetical protein
MQVNADFGPRRLYTCPYMGQTVTAEHIPFDCTTGIQRLSGCMVPAKQYLACTATLVSDFCPYYTGENRSAPCEFLRDPACAKFPL